MEATVKGIPVHYIDEGDGLPVLALHGMDVDHREMAGTLEPVFAARPGYRRVYPDLPGMGRTPAPATVTSADDVLDILLGLIDEVIGDQAFLVIGHSYGAYLARAIANRRPGRAAGLAVICAFGTPDGETPAHVVLHASADVEGVLDPSTDAEYRGYLVVQTPQTLGSFREHVAPGMLLTDHTALERIFHEWELREPPEQDQPYPHPTLILAGRQDSTVGYAGAWQLIEQYPRATFAVLDRAGHALVHEQHALLDGLIGEWLDRVREHLPARTLGT